MPLGDVDLTPKQTTDVALYFDAQDPPTFVLAEHLPKGMNAKESNATARAETDRIESNRKKPGLSLYDIKRSLTRNRDIRGAKVLLRSCE